MDGGHFQQQQQRACSNQDLVEALEFVKEDSRKMDEGKKWKRAARSIGGVPSFQTNRLYDDHHFQQRNQSSAANSRSWRMQQMERSSSSMVFSPFSA